MSDEDLSANYQSIFSGQLPGAELVIGLVGAVGSDLKLIEADLTHALRKYEYSVEVIRVSDLIKDLVEVSTAEIGKEPNRVNIMMTAGDEARHSTGDNAILALAAAAQIYGGRDSADGQAGLRPRQAYIIRSLKHPDEVNALRRIYGEGFFLIGVYVEPEQRKENLIKREDMSPSAAKELMERDESEGPTYGQRTRDTFHLSDFFVHLDDEVRTQNSLGRILDIVFADPYRTPLFDEYAMFMAFAAATRSADLSRQIGAVIACGDEVLASGVNECPRFGGGTYWPLMNAEGEVTDHKEGRDHKRGCDSNDREKRGIIEDAVNAIGRAWKEAGKEEENPDAGLLRQALMASPIDDITEYGRVVHAEMDALLTCSRNHISCRGATLYCTTFPCHNCAKHIIAAGIERVVYIEPYPKSKALKFHTDSAFSGFRSNHSELDHERRRVAFEPFVGVGPRRFFDLFSMKQGSGFPLKRKDKATGKTLSWEPKDGTIRLPMLPWNYLQREEFAVHILAPYLRGDTDGQPSGNSGQAAKAHACPDANSNPEGI